MHRNMSVVIYLCARSMYLTDKFSCHFLAAKKWRKNRAVTIFGVIRKKFLKRTQSRFYFVKRSPFFNANFHV